MDGISKIKDKSRNEVKTLTEASGAKAVSHEPDY